MRLNRLVKWLRLLNELRKLPSGNAYDTERLRLLLELHKLRPSSRIQLNDDGTAYVNGRLIRTRVTIVEGQTMPPNTDGEDQ